MLLSNIAFSSTGTTSDPTVRLFGSNDTATIASLRRTRIQPGSTNVQLDASASEVFACAGGVAAYQWSVNGSIIDPFPAAATRMVSPLFNDTWEVRVACSTDPDNFLLDRIQHLALPVIVLAVASIAQYSRYMRAAMLEVINSDYVRTARAKGLNERSVVMKHAFRNALIPLATVVALNLGTVLGGAVVTETVFSLDGMGLYFIRNLVEGDPYPVMAWLMITSVMIVFFNLVADVVYGYLDPRVRYD